ncbi:metallo-hydrolase oxidoreductase [Diplodia corticola]|uniref:Metallo-hydrolase oxidoreductase n=1 Tax=Diplodia corticola TaxID=236234 RepID=A0A1J9R5H5_9PEZI|nr:metallo-hydrolase oxidoreductase [Diplodia corticola]OJD36758.1 metallo-hydrolase oxidoreductase [Diplodia corticola]
MSSKPSPAPSTSFAASRLNRTTFLIQEDDSFDEHPFVYAKLHPRLPLLILSDTGCNSPRDSTVQLSKLRTFLEEFPVAANDARPLNPRDQYGHPERQYMVLVTHCHYDHIGGIEQFPTIPLSESLALARTMRGSDAASKPLAACTVVASSHCESFVTQHLDEHSLCSFYGLKAPKYRVSRWARDGEALMHDGQKVDVTVLHTPGHTPDELAWYDHDERYLYVGDSFYERGPDGMAIVFPKEGDWADFMASLRKMLRFVRRENEYMLADSLNYYNHDFCGVHRRVKLCCGHCTVRAEAEEMLDAVRDLFERILAGKVPVTRSDTYRDEIYDTWTDGGDEARFAVRAPRRLAEEARKQLADRAVLRSFS